MLLFNPRYYEEETVQEQRVYYTELNGIVTERIFVYIFG